MLFCHMVSTTTIPQIVHRAPKKQWILLYICLLVDPPTIIDLGPALIPFNNDPTLLLTAFCTGKVSYT